MSNLIPKHIIDKNGKATVVKINPDKLEGFGIDRTKHIGGAPSVAELIRKDGDDELNTFIPTRYPHTYGIDFARSNLGVIPERVKEAYFEESGETVIDASGNRGATSAIIHLWAKMEDIDDESLFITLANAYMEESGTLRVTKLLETGFEGVDVEAGYPDEIQRAYKDDRSKEEKEMDIARFQQQFGEDGYLFEDKGGIYVNHAAMPDGLSKRYWESYQRIGR